MKVTGKKLLGENPVLLPLYTPQIPSRTTDCCPFDIRIYKVVLL